MSLSAYIFNQVCRKGDKVRDQGLSTPDDVLRFDNLQYGSDEKWNILDIYRPKNLDQNKKLPVFINFHGGGWVYGDKELYQFYCMNICQRGFAVINFTYGLAPKFKFPSQLEMMNQVVEFIYKNSDKYGLDLNNIFLAGDSAGAQMAALYTEICVDENYAKNFNFKVPNNFRPKALLLNCGVYNVPLMMAEKSIYAAITKGLMKDFCGPKAANNQTFELMSPCLHLTKNFPPCYLMSANQDFLLYQFPIMEDKLKELGIKYKSKIYGSKSEILYHVFHLNIKTQIAKICNDDEINFLKEFIDA
ncbi:MAG: alpha/beta hydrolase [Treponemataceae bacterium]|nr:alpha/beta hydrolase [Treponemataceae bacterium]